jgi:PhnB protein
MSLMTSEPCINLSFDGQREAAFKFYEPCLNGKITFMLTWGDSLPSRGRAPRMAQQDSSRHAHRWKCQIAAIRLSPGSYQAPSGFVITENPKERGAERFFANLSAGGLIRMQLKETFWARHYGELTDRFGIPWAINCHKSE